MKKTFPCALVLKTVGYTIISTSIPYPECLTDFNFFIRLTGIFLVVTPGYVAHKPLFPVPMGLGGHLFCALLGNRYLLFTVAKVSILLVTCLAMERWYCVMRPVKYKTNFDRRRLLIYTVFSWVASCALQSHKFFELELAANDCVKVYVPFGKEGAQAFIAIYSFSTFVIPCLMTWLIFAHIRWRGPVVQSESRKSAHREKQQKLVLRMCAITAVVFTFCWLPAQLSYSLTPFAITRVKSAFHKACNVFAFLNSCINPLKYWYYHREYREEFIKLFGALKLRSKAVLNPRKTKTFSNQIQDVDRGITLTSAINSF